jgi:hypothetical protein
MKIMLDTQAYDLLASKPSLVEAINTLQHKGILTVLSTHIQEDELAGIKDPAKVSEIAKVERQKVATAGAVFGVSRFGGATYGDGSESGLSIDQVRSPSKGTRLMP